MKFLRMVPIIFIFLGSSLYMNPSYAETKKTNEYKVLSNLNKKLSISDVQDYLNEGDKLVKEGDFEKAKKTTMKILFLKKELKKLCFQHLIEKWKILKKI